MFIIPVMYQGRYHSFVPTLFLNSWPGVIGGLFFGLRKHHAEMQITETADSQSIRIADLLSIDFRRSSSPTAVPTWLEYTFNVSGERGGAEGGSHPNEEPKARRILEREGFLQTWNCL